MNRELKIQCSFAALEVRKNLKKLRDCLEKIEIQKAGELEENIHQIRVQTRRVSAALTLFSGCFDKKDVKKICKKLKRLRKSMNKARDKDIQIGMLNNIAILKSSLKYKDGINFLKNELGKERILCNKTIKEALANFKSSQAVKFISRLLCKFYAKSKSDFCISLPIIQEQINDKLEMIFNLLGSRDISNIHKARIIIKKIRYILEIFPKKTFISLKSHISKIKKLQTILGDINDIELFMKYLNKLTNQKNNILDLSSKTSIDYILKTLNKTKSNKLNSLDKYLQFLSNIDFQNKITNYIKQLDRSVAQ